MFEDDCDRCDVIVLVVVKDYRVNMWYRHYGMTEQEPAGWQC